MGKIGTAPILTVEQLYNAKTVANSTDFPIKNLSFIWLKNDMLLKSMLS